MKKWICFFVGVGGVLSVLLLAGCATKLELIEQRIQEEAEFFATLPVDAQERLREGRLEIGDSLDAARIVYGVPTRRYERITEAGSSMVWSYKNADLYPYDQYEAVQYPVGTRRGVRWVTDFQLHRSYMIDHSEYLRIEFRDGKVVVIDFIKPEELE